MTNPSEAKCEGCNGTKQVHYGSNGGECVPGCGDCPCVDGDCSCPSCSPPHQADQTEKWEGAWSKEVERLVEAMPNLKDYMVKSTFRVLALPFIRTLKCRNCGSTDKE